MNTLQLLTWAASNIDQADDLIREVSAIPAPHLGTFEQFVDATYLPMKRLGKIADSFPSAALKGLSAEEESSRLETAKKAIGDGKILEKLEKIIPIAIQLWQMWNTFKPV